MTEFAGYFLFIKHVSFDGGSVSVVAHAASLQNSRIVRVAPRETIALMAIETTAFEHESSATAQSMALRALHAGNWRMLPKWLKARRRIRAHKKANLLLTAFPNQHKRVRSVRWLHRRVQDIRKGLFARDRCPVQLELSRRSR